MFEERVEPSIRSIAREGLFQVRLKTFGAPESTVNDQLVGMEQRFGVTIGYRAHFPEIEVKVLARAATTGEAQRIATEAAVQVRQRLGDIVYGEGDVTFAESVGALCRERGLSLATAESCTGGLVASLITEPAGASDYFVGSIVSYANAVKVAILGVDSAVLAARGAVSAEVARGMAEGARRVLGADVALALTGVAGPGGGTEEKPVGLVHYAVAAPSGTTNRQQVFPGSRRQVQQRAAFAGLALVREVLLAT
jgi:nicotinamide-nucleotide amidase